MEQALPQTETGDRADARPSFGQRVKAAWRLVNHDFCPNQNAWAYKLKHPAVLLGIAALLSLFCGFMINPLAYLFAGVLLVVLAVGLAWPAVAVRAVAVEIDWGRTRTIEGSAVPVRIGLRNRLPIPVGGLTVSGLDGVADAKLPSLAPRQSHEIVWTAQANRRGIFPQTAAAAEEAETTGKPDPARFTRVQTQMPFGVWTAWRPIDVAGRLIVHPASVPLEGLVDLGEPRDGEERSTDRRAGTTGDLLGVRRFREGDSLRHVHWAQTARQRELIVCERQATIASAVRIGVDLPADADRLEAVMRATASVARRLAASGVAIELALPDASLRADGPLSPLLDGLAAVRLPERDRSAPEAVSLRIGFDRRCGLRLDAGPDWRGEIASAWRRLCRVA